MKPYKMARTHASGPPPLPGAPALAGSASASSRGAPAAPTHIVRGIHDTDFDMDTDHDHHEQQQHQAHHAASAAGGSCGAGAGSGGGGAAGQPSVPADSKVGSWKPFGPELFGRATANMRACMAHAEATVEPWIIVSRLTCALLTTSTYSVPHTHLRTAGKPCSMHGSAR